MHKKVLISCAWLLLVSFTTSCYALATSINKFKYPFYVGVTGGYGKTTWGGLVPPKDKDNTAIDMSIPIYVNEGGGLWGIFAGYEILPVFAFEAAYMHYPNAKVTFDPSSLFTYQHNGLTEFTTKTETASVMAKVMFIIPNTDVRLYSSLGVAEVHRSDIINDNWITSPSFGAGANYNFTEHVMGELGAVYTAGRGESELSPAEDYFPFIYSVYLRLAYRM